MASPKDKAPQVRRRKKQHKGPGGNAKAKSHKHMKGNDLLGGRIKQNGKHKIHEHGKFASSANVKDGKIAGIEVKHAEKGDVPVTKYKSTEKMAESTVDGRGQRVSHEPVQYEYIDTVWIGFAYIDDWGEEIIYWFPYDMIYDGDTGAIEYWPASRHARVRSESGGLRRGRGPLSSGRCTARGPARERARIDAQQEGRGRRDRQRGRDRRGRRDGPGPCASFSIHIATTGPR